MYLAKTTSTSQQSEDYEAHSSSASPFRHRRSTRESFAMLSTKHNPLRISRSYKTRKKQNNTKLYCMTFLLPWQNIMITTTYKREHLFGFQCQGESPSWWRGMAIIGRHGSQSWMLRDPFFNHKHDAERMKRKEVRLWALEARPQWHTSCSVAAPPLNFPNSTTNGGPSVQLSEIMEDIFFFKLPH